MHPRQASFLQRSIFSIETFASSLLPLEQVEEDADRSVPSGIRFTFQKYLMRHPLPAATPNSKCHRETPASSETPPTSALEAPSSPPASAPLGALCLEPELPERAISTRRVSELNPPHPPPSGRARRLGPAALPVRVSRRQVTTLSLGSVGTPRAPSTTIPGLLARRPRTPRIPGNETAPSVRSPPGRGERPPPASRARIHPRPSPPARRPFAGLHWTTRLRSRT